MKINEDKITTRRRWFTAGLRWTVAGLISVVSLHLLRRKGQQTCIDPKGYTGCRGCDMLNGCSLPQSVSFKQFLQKHYGSKKS